jgi:hypothetical protein
MAPAPGRGMLANAKFLQYLTDRRTGALLAAASDIFGQLSSGEFGFAEDFQIISHLHAVAEAIHDVMWAMYAQQQSSLDGYRNAFKFLLALSPSRTRVCVRAALSGPGSTRSPRGIRYNRNNDEIASNGVLCRSTHYA